MNQVSRDYLLRLLPLARRYARALVGDQAAGDQLVARALTELLESPTPLATPRIALYRAITQAFDRSHARETPLTGPDEALSPIGRQLLLLTALEGLTASEAALATDLSLAEADFELAFARNSLRASASTNILIIEDEPIIAIDIEELVQSCGHRVAGIAASETEAIAIAAAQEPGLILADINLGRGGDGARAVKAIRAERKVPVIFVTAYPERLLTGNDAEPAFVLTKPFDPMALAIATYQAVATGKVGSVLF